MKAQEKEWGAQVPGACTSLAQLRCALSEGDAVLSSWTQEAKASLLLANPTAISVKSLGCFGKQECA